ncbi:MAG: diguanylate cyclase [Magnetococcus sp. WYHC-3]
MKASCVTHLACVLVLLFMATPVLAGVPVVDVAAWPQEDQPLIPAVELLEDPAGSMTWPEVKRAFAAGRFTAAPSGASSIELGISHSAWWLRFTLGNTAQTPVQRLLELAYARLHRVDLYGPPQPDGSVQPLSSGLELPFASRPVANNLIVFPLTLPAAAESVYYLRVTSVQAISIPLRVWSPQGFRTHERNSYLFHAWYFGIASAMLLYNLMLFSALRERLFLLYVAFILGVALLSAEMQGLATQFLWTDAPTWQLHSVQLMAMATGWFFSAFSRSLLDTRKHVPILDRVLGVGMFMLGVGVLWGGITGLTGGPWSLILILGNMLLVLTAGLSCLVRGKRLAWFFLVAYSPVILVVAVLSLGWLSGMTTRILPVEALQWASLVEMLVFSFALADRFHQMRLEKEAAQDTLLRSLRQSADLLETRVAERTRELQSANLRLAELAATDGLTGLANRRHFDEQLAREWARARRNRQWLALLMIDVDFFKKYNDGHGHQAGDRCLVEMARLLHGHARRAGEVAARYGGEEFVILAPCLDMAQAQALAQDISREMSARALPHGDSPYRVVTLSIGVAALVPESSLHAEDLVNRADRALYLAKQNGRNRVEVFVPDLPPGGQINPPGVGRRRP